MKIAIRRLRNTMSGRPGSSFACKPAALGLADQPCWRWTIPLPARRPFREAKLRIDAVPARNAFDPSLVELLADALDAQRLVLASPHLSINQLAISLGRCRKQLTKLFRLSWLSPRIVEAIVSGRQPRSLNRTRLLETELPIDWREQESLFAVAA